MRPLVLAAVAAFAGLVAVPPAVAAVGWHYRDLTAASGAPGQGVRDMVAFPVAGNPRVYYLDGGVVPHVRVIRYNGGWRHEDITYSSNSPAPRSRLAGFAWGGTEPRLYYDDASNHVRELDGTGGIWRMRDLTAETGAPARAVYAISAFQINATDARVYYTTSDGHVNEFAYYNQSWHYRDLHELGGSATCCDLLAWTAGNADSRVYWRHGWVLTEYSYWQNSWHRRILTDEIDEFSVGVRMGGFTVGGANSRIYSDNVDGHLTELSFWQNGWHYRDLTRDTGGPVERPVGLSGFHVNNSVGDRVYSKDLVDRHIHEYAYYQGAWHYHDLTSLAGAPSWGGNVGAPHQVVAFPEGDSGRRVYYEDNGRIKEIAYY